MRDTLTHIIEQLRDFEAALLANTLDYIDSTPSHERYMSGDIASITPALGPTVGIAVTARIDSSTPGGEPDTAPFWDQLRHMQDLDTPTVWVVQAVGSRPDHECILGDGMAKSLYSVGCTGVVTDGRARDVAGMLATPFAAYCRGTAVHHCALRVTATNTPVDVGGITVNPGDLIHASTEGVIRIPLNAAQQLVQRAPQMRAFEHAAHVLLRRTDIPVEEKPARVRDLLGEHGFLGENWRV
ncbi:MAG: hypothetical protein CMJ49_03805 [Planctomycetaceae bacterium]|nr:hypothetical protein [Planctomycetaceae bacterium]